MYDNHSLDIESNFQNVENNFKNMEHGLKWFWNRLIYPPLNFIILTPLEKLLNYCFNLDTNDKGDSYF